ncbi:MAG TPA: N-acetylglucosamine-6-phosphate deacetylase [Candidatus Methylacidiphilales bacterium]|nr:N-acetylglucosamine-6-phosphate deacetylase [Candidatus Methylacidiphilales bacterium]
MKITARALSGQIYDVQTEGPVFKKITTRKEEIPDLPWIAPGLIDIQINGFAGVDFNRPLPSEEAWQHVTQQLYASGCTGFLIALITNREEGYRELLSGLTAKIKRAPRNCLGFHMEGPWLNSEAGYRGAHRAEWMSKPDVALLRGWREIAGKLLQMITIAPEVSLQAALRVIGEGRKHGIQFFLGHSAAMDDVLARSIAAGVKGWTHLGNAVPATVSKFDNVIFHTLARPELFASLIPDGLHLPPHVFRVLSRALNETELPRLLLTTDAMAGAATNRPGTYTLGETEVDVGADGSARLFGSKRLAGSTLTPFAGVFLAERMSGLFLEEVWKALSVRPASLLEFKHGLAEGNPADFCLISPEQTPYLLATYHRGKCVYEAP